MYDGMNASISRKCYFELADGYEDSANEEYQVAIKLFLSRYRWMFVYDSKNTNSSIDMYYEISTIYLPINWLIALDKIIY